MRRFNEHMNNHFRDCTLIAEAFDTHRQRPVSLHILPSTEDCIGVTDGTDAWICPVSVDAFGINIQKARSDVRDGKPPIRRKGSRRVLLVEEPLAPPRPTRRVLLEA